MLKRVDIPNSFQPLGQRIELDLCFFGSEECEAGHSWGPGIRQHYIYHYVHSGKGIMRIGEKVFPLVRGQGFLICPETIVYYCADDEDPWTYSWVGFQGLYANAYLERAQLNAAQPIFDSRGNPWFDEFINEMSLARDNTRSSDVHLLSILYRFFAELIAAAPEVDRLPESIHSKEAYIRKAIEFLEMHYSQKISILEIAHYVGLDRTYLSSLFKEKLGQSLQAYLLHFRMNRACELLKNQSLSIGDVSRSVGYTDPLLFSKMFRKLHEVSPKQYRTLLDLDSPNH